MKKQKPICFSYVVDLYIGLGNYGYLTAQKIQCAMGDTYATSLVYNFDKSKWNRNEYFGNKLTFNHKSYALIENMRQHLEKEPWAQKLEMAAMAVMLIDFEDKDHFFDVVYDPLASQIGTTIIANFIWRDRKTREIYPINPHWITCETYQTTKDAIGHGAVDFATLVSEVEMCKTLIGEIQQKNLKCYLK